MRLFLVQSLLVMSLLSFGQKKTTGEPIPCPTSFYYAKKYKTQTTFQQIVKTWEEKGYKITTDTIRHFDKNGLISSDLPYITLYDFNSSIGVMDNLNFGFFPLSKNGLFTLRYFKICVDRNLEKETWTKKDKKSLMIDIERELISLIN